MQNTQNYTYSMFIAQQTQIRKDFDRHKFTNSFKLDIIKKTPNQTYSLLKNILKFVCKQIDENLN
jgi:hypothetical protein